MLVFMTLTRTALMRNGLSRVNKKNDYFHKDGIPRRMSEVPIDYIDFTKFTKGAPDAKHFEVPSYCQEKCSGITACPRSS